MLCCRPCSCFVVLIRDLLFQALLPPCLPCWCPTAGAPRSMTPLHFHPSVQATTSCSWMRAPQSLTPPAPMARSSAPSRSPSLAMLRPSATQPTPTREQGRDLGSWGGGACCAHSRLQARGAALCRRCAGFAPAASKLTAWPHISAQHRGARLPGPVWLHAARLDRRVRQALPRRHSPVPGLCLPVRKCASKAR